MEVGQNTTFAMRDMVSFAAESLHTLGERDRLAHLYDSMARIRADGTVARSFDFRLYDTVMALGAAAANRWNEADAHFEAALQMADRLGLRAERADALRLKALELRERDQPGDRESATKLFKEAALVFRSAGLKWREKATLELLSE